MADKPAGLVSFVVLIKSIDDLSELSVLAKELAKLDIAHEVIGCARTNPSIISSDIETLCKAIPNLAIYTISTDSDDGAMSAGIEFALGDWILELPHVKDCLSEVKALLAAAGDTVGLDVSFQIIPNQRPWRDQIVSKLASMALGVSVQTLLYTSRLSSRQTLITWNRRKLRHKVLRVAPQLSLISTTMISSKGKASSSHARIIQIGLRTIVHATPRPIRWVSVISIFGAGLSVIASLLILGISVQRKVVPGWTTTNLQLSALSFLTLLVLSILSEYIYQIASATIDQPTYRVTSESLSAHYGFIQDADLERAERQTSRHD